ncbi:hypothetical protein CR513_56786, partial [Mucuna pruriens]
MSPSLKLLLELSTFYFGLLFVAFQLFHLQVRYFELAYYFVMTSSDSSIGASFHGQMLYAEVNPIDPTLLSNSSSSFNFVNVSYSETTTSDGFSSQHVSADTVNCSLPYINHSSTMPKAQGTSSTQEKNYPLEDIVKLFGEASLTPSKYSDLFLAKPCLVIKRIFMGPREGETNFIYIYETLTRDLRVTVKVKFLLLPTFKTIQFKIMSFDIKVSTLEIRQKEEFDPNATYR